MTIPVLQGTIGPRILVNYRADPEVAQGLLPEPFRPKLHQGHAIVGICLIRLENIRPASCSLPAGFSSENAAHRIAVNWDENGREREGVFIPRRDTGSWINHLTGGRIFPGEHHRAWFNIRDRRDSIDFEMQSVDGAVRVKFHGESARDLPPDSCFSSLDEASTFFEGGCIGYSVRKTTAGLDGLRLATKSWRVEALATTKVESSFFQDSKAFPPGSVVFDHTLLMRGIDHEWHAEPPIEPLAA